MIEKMMKDCMGEGLYNQLKSTLNGNTLIIEFVEGSNGSFYSPDGGIKLGMDNTESNILFHEMMHALQAYYETESSYTNALLNLEIEAHYAQYLYLKNNLNIKIVGINGQSNIIESKG